MEPVDFVPPGFVPPASLETQLFRLEPLGPEHDELREIRTRWFGEEGIELVVDVEDGRVVTAWRKGLRK